MSFLHVLGEIGKGALHIGSDVAPGPIGVVLKVLTKVIDVEKTSMTGMQKKTEVMNATVPLVHNVSMTPASPNTLELISNLIESVVMILNVLSKLFPGKA